MSHARSTTRPVATASLIPTILLALSLVVALVLAGAATAAAGTRTWTDGRGDPAGDITRVTVRWADGLTVTAGHARPLRLGDTYTAYVDTRAGRPGPEFRAFAQPNSDVLGVRRVSSWGDRGRPVRCRGLRVRADTFGDAPVRFFLPGGCLGDPDGSVRVTVRFERGSASDWAPGARRLGPPVKRS